jgi:preprotein translocase subunit SecA
MIGSIMKKIVGSKNDRDLKRLQPIIDQIMETRNHMVEPLK